MTAVAAFKACYTDWKLVRTRSVVQIVLEVPVEKSGEAYDVLGGMPTPGAEIWCAIARLQPTETLAGPEKDDPGPAKAEAVGSAPATATNSRDAKAWRDLAFPQQAGIRCSERAFHKFLAEKIAPDADFDRCTEIAAIELAASVVRHHCLVRSRADIRPNHPSARLWRELDAQYQQWMHEPSMVPA